MYLNSIFLPFLSFLLPICFGKKIGKYGTAIFSVSLITISALIAWFIFIEIIIFNTTVSISLGNWITSGSFTVSWGFYFDFLTATMLVVVLTISSLVHLYSCSYMAADPFFIRFMSYLSFFTFCMLLLVTTDSLIFIFLGWEGVGLASYLLINFWFTRIKAAKAGLKAILVNRFGDFGIAMAIFLTFLIFKTTDINTIFGLVNLMNSSSISFFFFTIDYIFLLLIFFFLGVIAKSAQIGLHTWLPDAMEGPTPVSALLHAATMVTAGVFLLLRIVPLLDESVAIRTLISLFGIMTALMAASIGLNQFDLKRVIAYSTCSQLGYMILSVGLADYNVALFHLFNHAFFKALLFLSAGVVIHALNDEQDMRRMGGLYKIMPFTYLMFIIGSFALAGYPFLTGFFSKDIIIEFSISSVVITSQFIFFFGLISAFFTAFYSFRSIYLTFLAKPNGFRILYENAHEGSFIMFISLIFLTIGSLFFGYLFSDIFLGYGTPYRFSSDLYLFSEKYEDAEFLNFLLKLFPLFFSLTGLFSFFYFIINRSYFIKFLNFFISFKKIETGFLNLYLFSNKKWFFDIFNSQLLIPKFLNFSVSIFYRIIDKGILEFFGPFGLSTLLKQFSLIFRKYQTGQILTYIFIFKFFILLIIFCFYFSNFIFFDILLFSLLIFFLKFFIQTKFK